MNPPALSYTHSPTTVPSACATPDLFPPTSQAAQLRAFDDFMSKVDCLELPGEVPSNGLHRLSSLNEDVHLMKFGQFLFANSPPLNDDASGTVPTAWETQPPIATPSANVAPSNAYTNDGLSPSSSLFLSVPSPVDRTNPRISVPISTASEPTEAELRHYRRSRHLTLHVYYSLTEVYVPSVHILYGLLASYSYPPYPHLEAGRFSTCSDSRYAGVWRNVHQDTTGERFHREDALGYSGGARRGRRKLLFVNDAL